MSSTIFPEVAVPQGVLADIKSFSSKIEVDTKEFFGEEEPVLGDPLEVLRIKVGNLILGDYKSLQQLAGPQGFQPSQEEEHKGGFDAPKIEQIITEMESLQRTTRETSFEVGVQIGSDKPQQKGEDQNGGQQNGHSWALQSYEEAQQQKRIGAIMLDKIKRVAKPTWHAPWKLKRVSFGLTQVIAGHQGWVRCLDVDSTNEFFVTGSNDRTIKFWDLASGHLKLSLTGHINTVRDVKISTVHPYLYSCSEDKTVRCWDLIQNKNIRSYHGHLSGVYTLALHPELNLLVSGGRDSTVRLWDIRTRYQVHCFEGHTDTVHSLAMQGFEPQCISGSSDCTVRLWDIGTGKRINVLTNHKKSIRGLLFHHSEYTFCSGAGDNLKVWKCPEGEFLRNFSGHNAILNSLALNEDNVLVSAADNGSMYFWDWKSGYNFQQIQVPPQPGSIASEAGIFVSRFDKSGLRLLTGECDKTIKIWEEDPEASPQSHPIDPNFRSYMASKIAN